jgi:DNA-directed RNA polymerase alpha subunit
MWTREVLKDALDMPLVEFGLSTKTVNRLEEVGIIRVRDLLKSNKAVLMAIPSFGSKSFEEVIIALREHGFY